MTAYTIVLVALPVWSAALAYSVARGLQWVAVSLADRATGVRR